MHDIPQEWNGRGVWVGVDVRTLARRDIMGRLVRLVDTYVLDANSASKRAGTI